MKPEISALMDGELDKKTSDLVIAKLYEDEDIRNSWWTYHLIGDALRKEPLSHVALQQKILQSLAHEPPVVHRRLSVAPKAIGIGLATAAGLLAVMTLLVMRGAPNSAAPNATPAPVASSAPLATPIPSEYLLAHQEFSPADSAFRYVALEQRDSRR
jgi:sigma-E factor negative regulatory protein RseA